MYNADSHTFVLPPEATLRQQLHDAINSHSDGVVYFDALLPHLEKSYSPALLAQTLADTLSNFSSTSDEIARYMLFLQHVVNAFREADTGDGTRSPNFSRYCAEVHAELLRIKSAWLAQGAQMVRANTSR